MMQARKTRSAFPSFSVVVFLPIMLLLLVIASIAPVIVVSAHLASDAGNQLAVDRAGSVIAGMERELRGMYEPITGQLLFLQKAVVEGDIDATNRDDMGLFALGLLASSPQIQTAEVSWPDGQKSQWTRHELEKPSNSIEIISKSTGFMNINLVEDAQSAGSILQVSFGDRFLKFEIALEYRERPIGVVSVQVSTTELLRYVNNAATQFDVFPFIFSDQDQWVMSPTDIPTLAERQGWSFDATQRIIDRSISNIWTDPQPLAIVPDLPGVRGHWGEVDGQSYVYLYRAITNLGPSPLVAAVAIRSGHVQWGWWITHIVALLAGVIVVLAPVAAWRLGRMLGRPMADIDQALQSIEQFEFDRISLAHLSNGRVTEWQRMGRRLGSTAQALSRLQTYIPQTLMRRLLNNPEQVAVVDSREVTVMFLDLEGFTKFSRDHRAAEVTDHLNSIFAIVGPVIEANGGVIDKYTGDGLLAFWDAQESQADHVARAIRSATTIAQDLGDHLKRHDRDLPRARIGVHTGSAMVGNVGFPGRVDYTLVGDTINTAQRTESALRGVRPEKAVVVAATADVFGRLGSNTLVRQGACVLERPVKAFICEWTDERGKRPSVRQLGPTKREHAG